MQSSPNKKLHFAGALALASILAPGMADRLMKKALYTREVVKPASLVHFWSILSRTFGWTCTY